jgi:hypothetical protein
VTPLIHQEVRFASNYAASLCCAEESSYVSILIMATTWRLGEGAVAIDDHGTPTAYVHDQLPRIRFLLNQATDSWHNADRAWGAGFVITDHGAAQWAAPQSSSVSAETATQRFALTERLSLEVQRTAGDQLVESYRWTNTSENDLKISSLAVSTPWRDVYEAGGLAQETAVHAHISATGAQAWVLARPMHGRGPLLGLIVRQGVISAYSVEARNQFTGADVRGHLLLHVTDQARHPDAFGGQPVVNLAPGAAYQLAWDVAWYGNEAEFLAVAEPSIRVPTLAAVRGEPLHIEHPATMSVRPSPSGSLLTGADPGDHADHLVVTSTPDGSEITSSAHGLAEMDVGSADGDAVRVGLFFHSPISELVRRRVAVILDHHRPRQRPAPRGFVACDTRTGLTVTDQGWPDWSDAAERTAMPVLLAEARSRELLDDTLIAQVDEALDQFALFIRDHLISDDGWVRRGSTDFTSPPRLYNTPWVVDFLVLDARRTGAVEHLELAAKLLEASVRHGVSHHLSIGYPKALMALDNAVRLPRSAAADLSERVERLLDGLREQALGLAVRGGDLPAHEVSYEQSIVAPLVSLLSLAHRRWPDERLLEATERALRWLLAFAGQQRHVRLRHIAIRHWDGYWFGLHRRWGDVFPHYWSALTAVALLDLPEELRTAENEAMAQAILQANLALYDVNARGCCAYLYPSCVDGVAAHGPDPLDNDQDWALIYALRSGLVP